MFLYFMLLQQNTVLIFLIDFLTVLLSHLHDYIKKKEEHLQIHQDWIIEEARNIRSLQYGGSFIQVVYRKLDAELVSALAAIINVIDQNFNTNLLESGPPPVQQLWLNVFDQFINWTESNAIIMATRVDVEFDFFPGQYSLTSPLFPFSFLIIGQMEVEYQNTIQLSWST